MQFIILILIISKKDNSLIDIDYLHESNNYNLLFIIEKNI